MTARICAEPCCPELAEPPSNRCAQHTRPGWQTSTRHNRLPKGWARTRQRILKRDGYRCVQCGDRATDIDHITPGDNHHDTNLQALCGSCHATKSSREGHAARRARY